jgi:hypothetical protein
MIYLLNTIFNHYSNKEVINSIDYDNTDNCINHKPIGLWLAKGKDWFNFVINEELNQETFSLDVCNSYKLKSMDNIIQITDILEYNNFNIMYGIKVKGYNNDYYMIDWNKVSKDYKGIYVSYHDGDYHSWNQSWDIDSLCIWTKDLLNKA